MPGPIFQDRVKETGRTSGSGPVSLQGAMTGGFFPFSTIGDGNWCYATIVNGTGNEETVEATYVAATNTLTIGTVLSSSNSGSQIAFPNGSNVTVWLTVPAAWYAATASTPTGNTIWNGHGAPSPTLGNNGDFYLDTLAHTIFGPKTVGGWGTAASLVGPAGTNGTNGTPGSAWYEGSVAPTTTHNDGDYYLSTTNGDVYQQVSGSWSLVGCIMGPQGTAGTNGTNGANGNTVLSGSGTPSNSLGADGDFYIDTTAHAIYGPKASGTWPAGTSIIGPAGSYSFPDSIQSISGALQLVNDSASPGASMVYGTDSDGNKGWQAASGGGGGSTGNDFGTGADGPVTISSNTNLATTTGVDDTGYVLKNYSSLTINAGCTLKPANRAQLMVIKVTGNCTINGTLSMSLMGANRGGGVAAREIAGRFCAAPFCWEQSPGWPCRSGHPHRWQVTPAHG